MKRRSLLVAAGVGALGTIAGCTDDDAVDDTGGGYGPDGGSDTDGETDADDEDGSSDGDGADDAADGSEPERTPPEAVVEAYLLATGEGDSETANELYHGEGEFIEEMEPTPGATVIGVAEWGDVEAIRESTNASQAEAEAIVVEMEQERERVLEDDPAVSDLVYVFAVITADDMDELQYVVTAVEVDGEWRVTEEQLLD